MTEQEELNILRQFFKEIAKMTIGHDEHYDKAVVYPDVLETALIKVKKEWWKE